MEINRIGVIGAGIMGAGVAQNLAQAGYTVILLDVEVRVLEHAREEIRNISRFQHMFSKASRQESPDTLLERIIFTTDYTLCTEVDFVLENVPEQWKTKESVYAQLDEVCHERTIFASNTSTIPITRLATATICFQGIYAEM